MDSLYQLLTGDVAILIDGSIFFIKPFTAKIKQLASIYAERTYEEAFMQGCLTLDQAEDLAIQNKLWSEEDNELLTKILPRKVEDAKFEYFINFNHPSIKIKLKIDIDNYNRQLSDLYSKKNAINQYTCEFLKSLVFEDYCLENSLYSECDEKVDGKNYNIIQIRYHYKNNQLPQEEIRKISQSNQWRSIWNSSEKNGNLFSLNTCDLSQGQIDLITWTRMYDSIYQSMDCPSEEVIKDDIAIDGWFIHQARKRKEEDKEKQKDNILSKSKKGGDLFLPAKTQEDVDRIIGMNGPQGKNVIKSLASDLRNKGSLKESELTHVKNDIQMAINRRRK